MPESKHCKFIVDITCKFIVDITFIDQPAQRDVKEYIQNAVGAWGGQQEPESYLFPDNIKGVIVTKVKKLIPIL